MSDQSDTNSIFDRMAIWTQISYRMRGKLKQLFMHLLTGIVLAGILGVFLWMFSSSLRPRSELIGRPLPYLPHVWTLDRYITLFTKTDFLIYYGNSILVSLAVILICVVMSTLGGYGLTRIDMPYKNTFARSILFGYMFPPILLAIPMFVFWRNIGLADSYIGLILAESAISLPFCLWMMWRFFQTVPISLEEAAIMSGASRFRAFYDVALPLAKPGMIAIAVYAYAVSWNSFTIPKILMTTVSRWPLTVGVFTYSQNGTILWGQVMAASSLVVLPSFILVYFLQRYLLQAFRSVG